MLAFLAAVAAAAAFWWWSSKKLRRSKATVCVQLLACFGILLSGAMLDDGVADKIATNKSFKHAWGIRELLQPSDWTTLKHSDEYLYVFQHVPRTGGDAMMMTNFGAADLVYGPIWRHQTALREREAFFEDGKFLVDNSTMLVSGFYSRRDLELLEQRVSPRRLRVFTIFRDPIERLLSLGRFSGSDIAKKKIFGNGSQPPSSQYWQEFGQNSLTRQFGDALFKGKRTRGMMPQQLLESAKDWIDNHVEYVGFFEALPESQWHIHSELFGDDVSVPFVYPWLFWIGAVISSPRREVRKFHNRFAEEHPDVIENVVRWQTMDIELYEYAKAKFNPSVRQYDTYFEFAVGHWMLGIALALLIATPVACLLVMQRRTLLDTQQSPAPPLPLAKAD